VKKKTEVAEALTQTEISSEKKTRKEIRARVKQERMTRKPERRQGKKCKERHR